MKHPHLPEGKRVDDQPRQKGWEGVKFRLALMVRRYPVQIAMVIMLTIVAYPIWLLVSASHNLKQAQNELRDAVIQTTASRQASSQRYCDAINGNTLSINALSDYFAGTVTKSQTEHPPPNQTKVEAQAVRDFVKGLKDLHITPITCSDLQHRIEADVRKLQKAGK